jgi:23S rRNA (uracil1939-C5)-methyltransferase
MDEKSLYSYYKDHISGKENTLRNLLDRIGCTDLFCGIIPSPVQIGFRSRAKFRVFRSNGHVKVIGTDPLKGDGDAKETIWILPDLGKVLVKRVCDTLRSGPDKFPVDGFEVQLAHGKKEAHLTIALKKSNNGAMDEFAHALFAAVPGLKGVAVPSHQAHYGSSFLSHEICGIEINAHHAAFFQSNFYLTSLLVYVVREILKREKKASIFDFYCGVGLFSLQIADSRSHITGIDNNAKAIESARKNAEILGYKNVSFLCRDVGRYIKNLGSVETDLAIINPPRSGCSESIISAVAGMEPRIVCQVSCDPETSVRDLGEWKKKGYAVQSLDAFDMFPFTDFLETAAVLKRE